MYRKVLLSLFLLASIVSFAKNNKTVSILGDSYSTYEGFVEPSSNWVWYFAEPRVETTDVDNVQQTWWHQYIKDNGYRLEKNNSYSGSTVCNTGYDGADYTGISFISRMNNLGCPDMIIVFGATNDSWANVPLGEMKYSKWTADDLKEFRPALCYMMSYLHDRYPNTEIIYLINDGLKPEVTTSIKEACDHFSIPYLELHDIDKTAGHPNIKGMRQIAEQLTRATR